MVTALSATSGASVEMTEVVRLASVPKSGSRDVTAGVWTASVELVTSVSPKMLSVF
jgi:hypothetical protein